MLQNIVMSDMPQSVLSFVQALPNNATKPAKKSSFSFSYKTPDSRCTAFGGVLRGDDGDVVDVNGTEAEISSSTQADSLPVDYVVITELSELFERAVSEHCFTLSLLIIIIIVNNVPTHFSIGTAFQCCPIM